MDGWRGCLSVGFSFKSFSLPSLSFFSHTYESEQNNPFSFDLPSGTLPLLTSALASGCWPQLETLDISLDLLALDAFAGPGLLGDGCVRC